MSGPLGGGGLTHTVDDDGRRQRFSCVERYGCGVVDVRLRAQSPLCRLLNRFHVYSFQLVVEPSFAQAVFIC